MLYHRLCFFMFIFAAVVINTECCSSEYHTNYNYNVRECELDSKPVGEYLIMNVRSRREPSAAASTCYKMPVDFMIANPNKPLISASANSHSVAASFVYSWYTSKAKIFYGPEATLAAVSEGKTFNVVLDSEMNYFIIHLKPKGKNDNIVQKIVSSIEALEAEGFEKDFDVVSCENLFHRLMKDAKGKTWSITITNKENTNAEYRFRQLSGGLGGFYARK